MRENTLFKKIQNRFKLIILRSKSYIRYISFSFLESNGIKNIGNLLFISNFKYNYQIIKFTKNDPTIVNLKKLVSKDSIFIDIGANLLIRFIVLSQSSQVMLIFAEILK